MHLKNLTLKGFKSFADTTSIDLEPGVTVVVGPNGSGKSNVVDAIAWVLGAQAPTAVRSGKMDDVIFAGTTGKPALGRAEVSLTIDNHSGTLPVEFSEVKITRTLFRSGESEYAINGVPCRLLDITELLSDGGVGRQQHVIVSQGQIDAVLNARPEDRRAIIEEAAGVLKYRKRKDRAQRRLTASDADLTRVKDLMREVRRQLRPLEKQADAARRHGDLVEELTALRIHLAGREIAGLREELHTIAEGRVSRAAEEETTKAELDRLSQAVTSDERTLADHGGDDLGDTLVRLESMRERARGLTAVLTERRRGIDRERAAFTDRGVIANLEAEAARLRDDLARVDAGITGLVPDTERLEDAERHLAADRAAFREEWGDGVPVPSSRAAEVRGELGALRAAIERGHGEAGRVRAGLEELSERSRALEAEASARRAELAALHEEEEPLVLALEAAEASRREADDRLADRIASHADAEAEHHRWAARAEALTLALDEARARAGAARLADLEGVLGTLLDLVAVDPGWEAAFEAAAGDALGAVVVRDPSTARTALDLLGAGEVAGAVLALGARPSRPRPVGADLVRRRVRGTAEGVDALLDALLGHVETVDGDWRVAMDLVMADPGRTVVTRAGDRFGPDGWRIGASGTGATGAALREATARAAAAERAWHAAAGAVASARDSRARAESRAADVGERLDRVDSGLAAAGDALQRIESDRRNLTTEADALQTRFDELTVRVAREEERVAELEGSLPDLEADETESLEKGRRLAAARAEIEERAATVGSLRTDLEVRAAGLEERRTFLRTRLAEIDERLARDAAEREAAGAQREALDRHAALLERLAGSVATRASVVDTRL
ncbi:MAG: AAA family ATPase, partial [Actinobacteria bacterium]|nr:AAA family ATPase [Actinomycetota bacterium]NIS35356.1 AAA family ATPase [Actinomycetota bacterium]NIT98078.1 AAA family ATPase [Actinomycetota bacterium]NIU21713.1 AAA family ATPase [Actinomycetota bacterium]NIU70051.1 AAA family ATPase [Actinomycetota bacterium]